MATGNVIGKIEVVIGNVKIISADGSVRDAMSDGFLYEGEQIISTDENALFQIKYLALPEETAYEGAFRVFADGSVIAGADAMENIASDKSLSDILATADETAADELETAAGEEGVLGSSSYTPYDVVAESSVLGFNRYPDTGVPLQGTVIDELADATGTNDAPTISVSGVNDLAYESGLATGSNADANTEFANGTFTISDPDGLHQITSVTINGTTIAIANLGNDNIINGTSGTLTITSYDSATGVATYQYELTSNTTDVEGVTETDTFTLTANDGTLDSAPATITIEIVDDMPTVVADNTTTAEDTTVIYNVITNTDGTSDSSGADTPATLIAAALADSSKGTVVFNPNGTVTFTPAEGVEGDVVVNYIIKDADGDTANSTLTINVGADSEPSFVNAANASVDETGGLHSDTQALTVDFGNDAGTLSLSAADADWNSTTNTLTANNGDWKIVVNDDNTYTVTQLQVMTHPNPLNPNDPVSVTITANADEVASTDHADTTFTVTFLDDGPTISATNAIGPVNQHDYIGGIDISGGADGVDSITISINGVSGVSGVKVGDDYVPFIFTDNGDGTGSGSFEYNGTHSFNLVINGNNTYTLHLEGDPTIIDIGSTESLSFDQKGSGPTATYEITYLDSESGRTFLATASAAPDTSIPLSLLSLNGDATPVSLSDGGINASASGFGISNNLLNSRYSAKDGYETESFIYNPENSAASITLDFSSFDANDVIYLKVDGKDSTDAAVTQNILINGSGEDFIWSGSAWTAIPGDTSFEYDSKGDIISYTVNADDLGWGTGYIDTMQVTAGFDGTNGTDLKVEFGFAAITTTTVTEEVEMSFTATVTDNDGDTDTVDFIVATDGDNNINGTIGDDYIAGTIGNDSLYGGDGNDTLVYDSADSVIDGGAGTDTLLVAAADTLDISNISAISHVEVIELGTGAKITDSSTTADGISIQDVIDITGGNELIINATNNDSGTVNINNAEFVQTGSNVDGYNIYTATATDGITTYTIHIDDAITVD
ncbi:hypothetical protein SAMN06313486_10310 [Epsilonproteobacteria bacterium SCGC AD-308-P11]|jgi:hypothetical protein|nr:hypothetical protein SAMN06313486_10310 [Epsilonproteobacteria bacterium SCGC AD-308-P11]